MQLKDAPLDAVPASDAAAVLFPISAVILMEREEVVGV